MPTVYSLLLNNYNKTTYWEMKIFSTQQIRDADAYTIAHEPIASIDLMERASRAFTSKFLSLYSDFHRKITIFCGLGNNGGDGLAIARLLHQNSFDIEVYIVQYSEKSTNDFNINLERLQNQCSVKFIQNSSEIPNFNTKHIIIDAIFGSGLSRNLDGIVKEIVFKLNESYSEVIAVDMPTGLFSDQPNDAEATIIKATHTISFQYPKLAFMLPQNADFVGDWHIVDIGLSETFTNQTPTKNYYTTSEIEKSIRKRPKFSHKGTYGNALLVAGSYGMMGAAILSAKACMRTGVGKMLVHIPKSGYEIMQTSIPEAMVNIDINPDYITTKWYSEELEDFDAVGVGCGLAVSTKITESLASLIQASWKKRLIIDADAINALSTKKGRELIQNLPENTILTPHPKEFQKLVNRKWTNDYEKLEILREYCIKNAVIVCLKGYHTAVCLPDGSIHFNSTGNPYMATAGSGDVLTGMILSLLAQGYPPQLAAILGVYLHGKAGDNATQKRGNSTIIATDIIENIRV